MRQTHFIREEQVRQLLTLPEAIIAVEAAFRDKAEGHAVMPPKLIVPLPEGDFRTMPAYLPRQKNLRAFEVTKAFFFALQTMVTGGKNAWQKVK